MLRITQNRHRRGHADDCQRPGLSRRVPSSASSARNPRGTGADFRAHERLFQLITQVAGRAGRHDQAGTVVVQTTSPAIPALTFALNHDYESFVEAEMKSRQAVGLPPYSRLARVVLAHPREATARQEAEAPARANR